MGKVIKGFKVKGECDCRWKYVNKVIEEDEGDIKVRKRRYESMNRGKNSLKGIECIQGVYKKKGRCVEMQGFWGWEEIRMMLGS